ncbi:hypothetical protein O6H91_03G065200 [Diphasiastrum complanatum]|uniref:Uncharacterized protein n=2 Tax=Diphasiastrum complanatum TaxID=34168 RepID=A0ACC2E7I7_DIPCM|nr:hypothetical protein O6H91_03G065200 [Diphasiastrum complanatum]KAJ7562341.1 hypothetical protein O6H91_03G065200 [Diphasiastrum complanatum]
MEGLPHGVFIERDSSGDRVDLNFISRLSRIVPTKRKLEDFILEGADCPGRRDRGRRELEEGILNASIAESRGRSTEAQSLDGDSAMREEAGNRMAELDDILEDEGKETSMIVEGPVCESNSPHSIEVDEHDNMIRDIDLMQDEEGKEKNIQGNATISDVSLNNFDFSTSIGKEDSSVFIPIRGCYGLEEASQDLLQTNSSTDNGMHESLEFRRPVTRFWYNSEQKQCEGEAERATAALNEEEFATDSKNNILTTGRDTGDISEESSTELLPLFVRTYMEGRTIVLHALPSDTIDSIHLQIFSRTGLPVSEQRLIFGGRQLQHDHTLKECSIDKDASLNLVARMRSTPLPQSWQLSIELVNMISRLCDIPMQARNMKFTRSFFQDSIRNGVQEYLKMAAKALPISEHMQVFQQSGAAVALISLLLSSKRSNQEYAEDCIKMFLFPEEYLSDHLYCAPIILNFCTILSRSAPTHDMYVLCRTVLCRMLDNIGTVHGSVYFYECKAENVIADFAPFVNELRELVIADLGHAATSTLNGKSSDSPELKEASDLTAFLIPFCKAWAECNANEATENSLNLFLPSTTDKDSIKLKLNTHAWLDQIFNDLLKETESYMVQLSDFHQSSKYAPSVQWPSGLAHQVFAYSHLFVLLRGIHAIANVLDGGLHSLLLMLQERHVALNIVIQNSVCTHGDYWLCEHKYLLNFESKRKLAIGMLPEPQDDYEERHDIVVPRSQLLSESFESLAYADVGTLQGGITVEFTSEEATGPGVLREWFSLICREIFNPNNALFVSCSSDPRRFHPNPASGINPGHLTYFRFAGRVIALAIMHKVQLDVLFPLNFFKQLANLPMSWEDSKHIDTDSYMHFKRILDMDAKEFDDLGLTFVSEVEPFGCRKVVELCPNGKEKIVNGANRLQFVELLVQQRFVTSIADQVQYFSSGFSDILLNVTTQQFFQALEPEDFDLLLFGQERNICLNDWKAHTEYHGYSSSDNQIVWFWKVLEQMTVEQQKRILFFATAVRQLPVEGFSGLSSKFHIHRFYQDVSFVPQAHTCFYQLLLPPYSSLEMMNKRFHTILEEDKCAGFGFS